MALSTGDSLNVVQTKVNSKEVESLGNPEPVSSKFPKSFKLGKHEITIGKAKWTFFFASLVLALLALLCIIIYVEVYINSFDIRVDCNPDLPLNYDKCLSRGCIWVQRTEDAQPLCFFPHGYGYAHEGIRPTSNGFHVDLNRTVQNKMFGGEVDSLNLNVYFETPQRLRLKFADTTKKRYEVPLGVPLPPAKSPSDVDYKIDFTKDQQFGVIVKRNTTGTVIFDTNVPGMIFSDQFIQITTRLASNNIYGFGEHFSPEYKRSTNWKKWSLFSRDVSPENDYNLYGVHPFYMNVEADGNTHGVFLLNSNAMEVVLQPAPALTFRTIGGILDFYIFLGPTPEDVVKQYIEVIGLPLMPPYWGLGFQLSRWGYNSIEDVKTVAKRTIDAGIPYDVQYFDIDYMDNKKDFTYDHEKFNDMPSFIDYFHSTGRKIVIILDPAIASNKTLRLNYPPLDVGINRDIFIKINGSYLEGMVWPGKTYYPDFSKPEIKPYWTQMCTEFHKSIQFDGLWIDMNEPSNFVQGSLDGCGKNSLNYPPYPAGVLGSDKDNMLFDKTICMDADQHAGKHYDVHSLYAFFQANVTFRSLAIISPGNRSMVLSRSTFPGSGQYTAHWLGDNFSTWPHLRASIPGILQFNTFGIPFVGADICGFNFNTTEEMCLRWMQLGAFYPFSRNHNSIDLKEQDPVVFGKAFVESINKALFTRYELLPYLYTLFHFAHTEGSTVARPLLHEFPTDVITWNINYQFLWGPALLISPFVNEGEKIVDAYFPAGIWYDFYKGSITMDGLGSYVALEDEGYINLHVRGGYILPLQQPNVTTELSRMQPMGLFIAPDSKGSSKGVLFWDDGISFETQKHKKYFLLEVNYEKADGKAVVSSEVKISYYAGAKNTNFGYMKICNQVKPSNITLNGKTLDSSQWTYIEQSKVLYLKELNISIADKFEIVISE